MGRPSWVVRHGSSVVGRPSWIVRRGSSVVNNCFITPKLLAGLLPNLTDIILMWPSVIIVEMVMVRSISRSQRLKIDFRDENF